MTPGGRRRFFYFHKFSSAEGCSGEDTRLLSDSRSSSPDGPASPDGPPRWASTASRSGIEYYSRSGNTWSRGSGFNPSNNDELYTGFDVDVSGELFVVGAPTRNGNARRDRFFIIRRQ